HAVLTLGVELVPKHELVLLPNCLGAAVPRQSATVHSRDVGLDVKPPNAETSVYRYTLQPLTSSARVVSDGAAPFQRRSSFCRSGKSSSQAGASVPAFARKSSVLRELSD